MAAGKITKRKKLNYVKWGYFFIAPFFIVYTIFSLIPLVQAVFFSFCEYNYIINYTTLEIGWGNVGWFGLGNYKEIFANFQILKILGKTLTMWIMGFIPQILVSLLLAVWFTDSRLKIKGASFFKAIIYMPNLIMATALAALFGTMFGLGGPFEEVLFSGTKMLDSTWPLRWLIAFINFIMWFGNTTILLMAGVMGIDESIFEAATIDGAGPIRTFKDITMPLLMPIFIYVFLTSLIGGVQMFDINMNIRPRETGRGGSSGQIQTLIMYLNVSITGQKYGVAGAISIVMFIFTGTLSFIIYKTLNTDVSANKAKKKELKLLSKKVNANV